MNEYRKKVIITGGTSGIGKAAAIALAKGVADIVITGSNAEKGEKAIRDIKKATGNDNVVFMSCDLSAYKYVRSFVTRIKNKWDRVDVLINNAGTVKAKRQITEDGREYTIQVNYLSHFLLTIMLLDLLKKSRDPRIINVVSRMERMANLDFSDLDLGKRYNYITAYANSKLAQLLFTYEMAERYPKLSVNAIHPGGIATGIYNFSPLSRIFTFMARPFMQSPEKGAETLVYLAESEEIKGVTGKYFINKSEARSSVVSYDKGKQKELWELSRKAVGYHKDVIRKRENLKKQVAKKDVSNKGVKK